MIKRFVETLEMHLCIGRQSGPWPEEIQPRRPAPSPHLPGVGGGGGREYSLLNHRAAPNFKSYIYT